MEQTDTACDDFGAQLRERRESLGLTRAAVAKAAHVAETTIKAIELGRRKPSAELLHRLTRCTAMEDSQAVTAGRDGSVLNCWIAPGFNSLRLLGDLLAKVNSAGGSIEQSLLYLDHRSAADWCSFTNSTDYQSSYGSAGYERSSRAVRKVIESAPLDMIALGCGNARREVSLATKLLEKGGACDLRLYLLDISQPLLSEAYAYAAETLESHSHVSVTAVQGNFHDLPRYGALLYRPENSHRRRLITMLGYTFGNLDNELRWVADALSPFARGDLLLLDVQRGYAPSTDPKAIRRLDPGFRRSEPTQRQRDIETFFLGPLKRYRDGGLDAVELSNELGSSCVVPGSYQLELTAHVPDAEQTRRFVLAKARRYSVPELAQAMADLGWHLVEHMPSGDDRKAPISQLLFERR